MHDTSTSESTGAQGDPTIGVGGQTSGQRGASPSHETQQETGGNGGAGLTRNQAGPDVNAPNGGPGQVPAPIDVSTGATDGAQTLDQTQREPLDSAMTHANPGAQDTRSHQAGSHPTGLGTPETGGSHDEDDLPPPRS